MWILFDDASPRGSGESLVFERPSATIVARRHDEVKPALAALRDATKRGHHVAGYLAYEAGFALDPALADLTRKAEGPLLAFGVFDKPRWVDRGELFAAAGEAIMSTLAPRIEFAAYQQAARRVERALHAGDYYQANLTFPCDLHVGGDPLALYARLAARGGGGWGGVLVHDEGALVSFSPEQFFRLTDRELEAMPMKGTLPADADPQALLEDDKQRAENLMIVDLLRNDMARVSRTGSVAVPELFAVESYPTVHQMVSRITSTIDEGLDALDVLEKLFPCGSVTGAPKIAAMRALVNLEPEPRGAYCGTMGWIEPSASDGRPGNAAFNVLIRTIEIVTGKAQARCGLGSGLVVDSKARDEWSECMVKGQFVNGVSRNFDLIETMAYDPIDGIVELERHLLRLKRSGAELGFTFDRHSARNELQAATFGHREAAMVRLLASPTGTIAIEMVPTGQPPHEPVAVQVKPLPIRSGDMRTRFKTTNRDFYDKARDGDVAFETLFTNEEGRLTEGSFTNIFVEKDGMLVTPPARLGLIPGILREKLIDEGRAVEGELTVEDLGQPFCIGNSARGLMRARLVSGR